ncbi:MAG: hypothetical protein A3J58_01135 [Candidatus Sungbacteria bacterium RIFCSPHIGHO2_02_FULL_52_23]|uniref:Uncharacterized protein n=1 Tax=Candidatus Sungbacteria bacterium RIFCSPHIGHO2_02_FULL_52_23 TaxID=1802274 RepID=A0A1G2KXJ3_9BACT|nr:MAG: hypothetical protein A3J58_01135 [Candidatus Sungbacteria bacterium RIFCSPHIGHO2_02_FULL_52_23]
MTTLLLASQKIFFQASPRSRMTSLGESFAALNRRGIATAASLVLVALGIGLYVSMLVSTFSIGIQLRQIAAAEADARREARDLEMSLRAREANFAARYAPILEGMDEVSAIIYLDSDGVAMNTRR